MQVSPGRFLVVSSTRRVDGAANLVILTRAGFRCEASMGDAKLQRILDALRVEISHALGDQLDSVILFGSQARAEAHEGSDIDVLVVLRGDFDCGDMIRRTSAGVAALSLEHDVVISRTFVSRDEFENSRTPFLLNVHREGVPV